MATRWEGDNRGRGVGDARQLVPGTTELVAAFNLADWVAEQPEVHLRPHVEQWCQHDGRLALRDASAGGAGVYVLELEWHGGQAGVGPMRAAVFSLIGSFAESATYVRQRPAERSRDGSSTRLRFEIGTGEPTPDSGFAPHGHSVVINVTGGI